jgi:hypothetical protein
MEVRALVAKHNRRALLTALELFAVSALLWLISYWVAKLSVYMVLWYATYGFGRWGLEPSSKEMSWMALVLLAGLAVECVLQGKRLYDREAYAKSAFLEGVTDVEEEFVVRRVLAMPESGAELLAELLFAAPRWTARAGHALLSLTVLSPPLLDRAQSIADELAKEDWVLLEPYQGDARALLQLHRLGVLQLRVRKGEREIRLSGVPEAF